MMSKDLIKKPVSRRDFLKAVVLSMGAIAAGDLLSACGKETTLPATSPTETLTQPPPPTKPLPPTLEPTPERILAEQAATATWTPPQDPTPTQPTVTPTSVPAPDLVVVRNAEPEELVRTAIAAFGGMEKFVPKGANVIIKPNLCVGYRTYEYAATTNPWVVGTLVKLCFEAGAGSVKVMDHTWKEAMWDAYATSGVQREVEAAGGQMAFMYPDRYIPTELPKGVDLKSIDLYEDILKADVFINVPIAKHHQDAKLTLGMKSLMGAMDNRLMMHKNLGQRIADLNSGLRPTLNVMDAVRMLMAFGPTGGALSDVKKMDTVIVSQDVVALDSYTATLFEMKPSDLDYVNAAVAMGLGRSDLENLRIEEINL